MSSSSTEPDFRRRFERLESQLQDVERLGDPVMRAKITEIVQAILEFHGAALFRMLDSLAEAGDLGSSMIQRAAGDDLVGSMLSLHGLHPLDLATRVQQALDQARPYLASHGGNVELLEVGVDGAIRLRFDGNCGGCPSSQRTLKFTVEEAVYAVAPEVTAIHVEGTAEGRAPAPAGFVAIDQLTANR